MYMEKEHPLITEYRKTIPSKLENLRKLIEEAKKYQNKESLEELRKIVHKLTGNSGTYGFMRVSNFCKALDLDLQEKIKQLKEADAPINGPGKTINNNLFVGSTAELQKLLKDMKDG